ncbi:hypothetical protein PR202_ga22382 [Eleusine coracana subsp. coracana]|uniref:Uncharacterized protein n=1 Tax=Eleusine coracana subsp. coracana TaxID=191504 RepID=A0AAV5D3S3_ELECO|nr:hypothetical protein PR202_ga22382 [Eleusine coracana subsp. coracana]
MSRFPFNIDDHLRPLSPLRFQQPQPQPQAQPNLRAQTQARGRSPEMEMVLQDMMRVCNADIKTPFQSVKVAVNRCVWITPKLAPFLFSCGH